MQNSKYTRNMVLGLALSLSSGWVCADTVNITATVNGAPTPSQIVDIHFTGTLGSATFSNYTGAGYAGLINWNNASGTDTTGNLLASMPGSFAANGTFSTYCIDITQDIGIGGTYPFTGLTTNLTDTPVIAPAAGYSGMGSATAQAIDNLYFDEYNIVTAGGSAIQYDANASHTDSNSNDQSAAFQIAIWDIIYGINATPGTIDVTSNSNRFWVDNGYNSFASFGMVAGMADRFAEQALTGPKQTFGSTILALTTPTAQDQLVVGLPLPAGGPTVPTPTAAVAGLSLLAGLGVWKRVRRVR
jgi:hypothetical protein